MKPQRSFLFLICLLAVIAFGLMPAWAQSTISTGSIQGTVTDPNGAVVQNASVTITNKGTGQQIKTKTSSSGAYASGPLQPGAYEVRVEAPNFQTQVTQLTVQVGVTSNGNAKLAVGKANEVVEVTSSATTINTEQPTVQGVLTTQQIENLPINGRNFLDLAQLEPGVQIQDGGNFDPTKNGFSSISFGGRFGRTARIEVDGIDISDETVGTTTQNLPASAIQEFQVSQSSLDLSTELTSSGAVNVVTRSGSNKWHGEGFYLFRDSSAGADISNTQLPFQRNNFGGNIGGFLIKDKLFFFADAERLKQDLQNPVATQGDLSGLSGAFNSPFRETEGMAKLNWKINDNMNMFYRFSYEQNHSIRGFNPDSFQPFLNQNNTPAHVIGWDYTQGNFTHQVRFGWMKFRNGIGDATTDLGGTVNPLPNISLTIGPDLTCLAGGVDAFCSGPNVLAPQKTFQENTQIKYDGSKIWGNHIIRYGFGYNHIQGGGFAKFFSLAPTVNADPNFVQPCGAVTTDCIANVFAGGTANPLNYPVDLVVMGNGQGFSSEKPAFGLPGGGLGPDNRINLYVGDSWKFRPNLTFLYGVRYVHDSGRLDSDLPSPACNTIDQTGTFGLDPAVAAAALAQCKTNILDLWSPGLGNPVKNPGGNFGPQVGFAWSPGTSSKTVIRGGIGLYYENSIFNNNLFNRPGRLQQGLFLNEAVPCAGGQSLGIPLPTGGSIDTSALCGQPIGLVADQLAAAQQQFQASVVQAGPAANGAYIGNTLAASNANGIALFAPDYKTPRSVQMNIGFQRELGRGVVLSADYIRNVATHTLLLVDTNHVGDARFFNLANAQAAIGATLTGCGATSIDGAIASCPGLHPGGGGATIADFAGNGLDSGNNLCGGLGPCPAAAFPGQNPILGPNQMLFPAGRSVYNGFDTSLKANVTNPFSGVKNLYWQVSYSLSRYVASALDSDFINTAIDNNHPTSDLGPNGLDRTHQFSFGGTFDFPGSIRFGVVGHVYSPLAVSLTLPAGGTGGIFTSDVTGDGSGDGSSVYGTGDLVPGTNIGAFGRDIKSGDLASFIANYNATQAGQATPAGQVLIQNGLFTLAQLQALGGVLPTLDAPPAGNVGLGWLKTFDLKLSYPRKIGENFTIEPGISVFNAFNNANFDLPGNTINGFLNSSGSVNETTASGPTARTSRVTPGSGVFDLGAPRVIEFGLKLSF